MIKFEANENRLFEKKHFLLLSFLEKKKSVHENEQTQLKLSRVHCMHLLTGRTGDLMAVSCPSA